MPSFTAKSGASIALPGSAGEIVRAVLKVLGQILVRQVRNEIRPTLPGLRIKVEKYQIQRAFENAQVFFNDEMVNQVYAIINDLPDVDLPPMWLRDP